MIVLITKVLQNAEELLYNTRNTRVFSSLEEMATAANSQVMEITTLITTSDIFVNDIKKSCNEYFEIVEDKFIKIQRAVHLVNNLASPEIAFMEFRNKQLMEDPEKVHINLDIKKIDVSQESLIRLVQGELSLADDGIQAFKVARYTKSAYIAKKEREEKAAKALRQQELTAGTFIEDIGNVAVQTFFIKADRKTQIASLLHTSNSRRQAIEFATIYSQIVSKYGKTVLVEDNLRYLTTAHYCDKSGVTYKVIDIFNFLENTNEFLEEISNDKETKLYLITSCNRAQDYIKTLDKFFYIQSLQTVLEGVVDFIIFTMTTGQSYIGSPTIVLSTDLPEVLESISELPSNTGSMKFIGISDSAVTELQIQNEGVYSNLLTHLLGEDTSIDLYKITSLKGGSMINDLYLFN